MSLPYPVGLPFPGARLVSRQGMRPRRSTWHNGDDWVFLDEAGRPARGVPGGPVAYGVVEQVCRTGSSGCSGYGNAILVSHGTDYSSWYAHLDAIFVEEGDEVYPGDHLYNVGVSFGTPDDPARTLAVPHLHLEILRPWLGWPVAASRTDVRYDVLHELAAVGIGLVGTELVAGLDPFIYDEQGLVTGDRVVKSFVTAPKELQQPSRWPLYLTFGGLAVVGAGIALAGRGRAARERETVRRFPRR